MNTLTEIEIRCYLYAASKKDGDDLVFPLQDYQTLTMNLCEKIRGALPAALEESTIDESNYDDHEQLGYERGWNAYRKYLLSL